MSRGTSASGRGAGVSHARPARLEARAASRRAPREQPPGDSVRALELAEVLESTSDAVVGVSTSGEIIIWGSGAERLFGWPSADALGRHMSMLAPPTRAKEPENFVARLLDGSRVERIETERVTRDGLVLRVEISLAPIRGADGAITGVLGVFRDISRQHDAELALESSERRYRAIFEALTEGVVVESSAGTLLAANASANAILGVPSAAAGEPIAGAGDYALLREDGAPLPLERHPTALTLRTGEPQRGTVLAVVRGGEPRRWVSVDSSPLRNPGESSPYAAVASFTDITELRATLAELEQARSEDLERLALLAEYRDDDTNRHTERVGRGAALLAEAVGLDADAVWTLRRAAPLHDIGKVGIPDRILLKPSGLTAEEFEVMKTHTVIGERILCHSRAPVLRMARTIALTHHERWDGAGYPHGRTGEAIPITGRLVAVVDAFDAMTHERRYKKAVPVGAALQELERCSGAQFDPALVAAFLTLDHAPLVHAGG